MSTWEPAEAERNKGGRPGESEPRLTIHKPRTGYLNATARRILFGPSAEGKIRWDTDTSTGTLSMVPDLMGVPVNRNGHLTVTIVTSKSNGAPLPVTIRLRLDAGPRLVLAGIVK